MSSWSRSLLRPACSPCSPLCSVIKTGFPLAPSTKRKFRQRGYDAIMNPSSKSIPQLNLPLASRTITTSSLPPATVPLNNMSSEALNAPTSDRRDLRPHHGNSFHPRALAVTAAHRFASTSSLGDRPDSLAETQSQPESVVPNGERHVRHADIESGSPFQPHSPTSPKFLAGLHRRRQSAPAVSPTSSTKRKAFQWQGSAAGGGTGDEPGVDVRSQRDEDAYSHLKGSTRVTVVDYTSNPDQDGTNTKVEFAGDRLQEWLDGHGSRPQADGKPSGVRWIHIDGLNWEVIKTLSLRFNLHPLAIEDALRASNSPRSKMDFYKTHLYMQILVQHMHSADEEFLSLAADAMADGAYNKVFGDQQTVQPARRGSLGRLAGGQASGSKLRLPEGVEGVFEPSVGLSRLQQAGESPFSKAAHRITVDELSAKYMVPVRRGIISVFMMRDGTLISLCRQPIQDVMQPIYHRLEDGQSLLRRSGDVSMLAQAMLDVSVDLAIEISQTFEAEILKLEATVLVDPQMETVRHLHILSSQLIRLRRSLTPLLHVCYIVRDQDAQRSAAAAAMTAGPRPQDKNHSSRDSAWLALDAIVSRPSSPTPSGDHHSVQTYTEKSGQLAPPTAQGPNGTTANQGFFTPMTKVYIGDVLDHLELIVSSMDQFVATCDHLTDYVFNVLSFQTNNSMERLSIVTVVFLPLTFIASYFGMNFTGFPEIEGSVSYFWKVAAPSTVVFFLIFSFSYLRSGFETTLRKLGRWRRTRMVEKNLRRRQSQAKVPQ